MQIKDGDVVSFDFYCAKGMGVVREYDPKRRKCSLSVFRFEWKDGYEEDSLEIEYKDEISETWCRNISVDSLAVIPEEEYSSDAKVCYLQTTEMDNRELAKLSDEEKARIRSYVDELAEQDEFIGLYWKGYLTYGGSPIYDVDWNESRRCLEKCFEMQCRVETANSLGYIYYYGRCNNGVGEYDKAFRYFSIAAMGGNHEAIYKIGDMFLKGKGVPENVSLANDIYKRVYKETRSLFCDGETACSFADAALRMAGVAERERSPETQIYAYYLEAEYAINERKRFCLYGDESVRASIQSGIEKYRPNDRVKVVHDSFFSPLSCFEYCLEEGEVFKVSIERVGQQVSIQLAIVDKCTKRYESGHALLVIPELSYCGFVKSYKFKCKVLGECEFREGKEVFFCNAIEWSGCGIAFDECDGRYRELESFEWRYRRPTKADEYTPESGSDLE